MAEAGGVNAQENGQSITGSPAKWTGDVNLVDQFRARPSWAFALNQATNAAASGLTMLCGE